MPQPRASRPVIGRLPKNPPYTVESIERALDLHVPGWTFHTGRYHVWSRALGDIELTIPQAYAFAVGCAEKERRLAADALVLARETEARVAEWHAEDQRRLAREVALESVDRGPFDRQDVP